MEDEIFKDIPNYEGLYQVSNFGRVKSLRFNKEKILKTTKNNKGYCCVLITKEKLVKNFKVHKLVAVTFLDFSNTENKVIDHLNEIKTDNRVENLQIVSQRENVKSFHRNKKGFVGTDWHEQTKKWRSRIWIVNKIVHLGLFEKKEDALIFYEMANLEIENFKNPKQFRILIKSKI